MPRRDRSAEAVAREWLQDREEVYVSDIAALLIADRRAERGRVRRIVRRECEAVRLERANDMDFTGSSAALEAKHNILAALRDGKGTR